MGRDSSQECGVDFGAFHRCDFPSGRLSLICWLISGREIHFCSVCLDCCDTHPCRHPLHPLAAKCSGAAERGGVLAAGGCSPKFGPHVM